MKLRPVLLVLLLLSGFYYVTTHLASSGAMAPIVRRALLGQQADVADANTQTVKGALGASI